MTEIIENILKEIIEKLKEILQMKEILKNILKEIL